MILLVLRHWQSLMPLLFMATMALFASQMNSNAGPPSSVFVSWPQDRQVPELVLTKGRFTDGNWYIDLQAEGFIFSDFCQTVQGPQTIGHAHVYSGEQKIASAFSPRVELGALSPGQHRFRAVLRAQDHRALIGPEGMIAAEIVIEVSGGKPVAGDQPI